MNSVQQRLIEQYNQGTLALFLGAGVSASCGLPGWDSLAEKVIEKAYAEPTQTFANDFKYLPQHYRRLYLSELAPLELLRLARRDLGDKFITLVSGALYESTPSFSPLLKSIASLKKVRRFCTFNYDNLLEQLLIQNA